MPRPARERQIWLIHIGTKIATAYSCDSEKDVKFMCLLLQRTAILGATRVNKRVEGRSLN